jgi:hypothetical protein
MNAARPSSYVLVLLSAGRGAFTLEKRTEMKHDVQLSLGRAHNG